MGVDGELKYIFIYLKIIFLTKHFFIDKNIQFQ